MLEQEAVNLQKILRQQESLRAIIESISSELELRPLLTRIVQHACELLDADRGTIGLVDEACAVVRTEAVYQMPPSELGAEMPRGVGLAGKVLQSQKPLIMNRYGELDTPLQPDLIQDAVIGLPIFWHEQMIGFFGIGADPPHRFGEQDVELLTVLARHAAIAIENARLFDQMQRNLAEAQLLYETSRRMTNAFDVDDVIEAYLQHVAVRGRYVCTVALYEFNDFGERTAVIVRGVWSPDEALRLLRERLPYTRDAIDPLLDRGQTVLMSDVHTDPRANPELRRLQMGTGRPALAFIPLIVRRQRIGVVILTYPAIYQWQESDLWPYQVTAAQLAAAIDTRRQQLLLVQSSQEVAVLHERQRLARELHDSVTQLIFSMTLIAQSVAPAWQRSPVEGEKRVGRLLELSQSALAEMRALLFELRLSEPPPLPTESGVTLPGITRLRHNGLVAALQQHIRSLKLKKPVILLETAEYRPQPLDYEIALFRIVQEALNNIVKYAEAKTVTIRLYLAESAVHVKIRDDGLGFNPNRKRDDPAGGGLGLRTMQERAEALYGRLTIQSAPGQGTTVHAHLPIKDGGRNR
jgi:signal transduction histidine kinase